MKAQGSGAGLNFYTGRANAGDAGTATMAKRSAARRPSMSEDERAIRELIDTWLTASKAGDVPKVLSLMSGDVVFMVPGREPFGKQEFAGASQWQDKFRMEATSNIVELQVLGNWAYLRNHLTVTMTPKDGGKPVKQSGYTLTILRKQPAGNWLLVRDANLLTPDGR
jgi:uncharacterized protein (TIGR02246 family)